MMMMMMMMSRYKYAYKIVESRGLDMAEAFTPPTTSNESDPEGDTKKWYGKAEAYWKVMLESDLISQRRFTVF